MAPVHHADPSFDFRPALARPLLRSHKPLPPGAQVADVDHDEPIRLIVVFRAGAPLTVQRGQPPVTRQTYAAQFGTPRAKMEALAQFGAKHGMTVETVDPARHIVVLSGRFGQAIAAFRPEHTGIFEHDNRRFAARWGHLFVPTDLHDSILTILGFDDRTVTRPSGQPNLALAQGNDPLDVARRYGFPLGTATGRNQTIGLISIDGGYNPQDVTDYFERSVDIEAVPPAAANVLSPTLTGRREVMLNICIAGKVAPDAKLVLYIGTDDGTSREHTGFLMVILSALQDAVRNPSVLCITAGDAESNWDGSAMDAFDQLFKTAVTLNVTVCVASGDRGARDDSQDGQFSPQFPAASPYVIGCGGTTMPADANADETGWSGSGGGYSRTHALPDYQASYANFPGGMRGVPDVAGNADPNTGYRIRVDGGDTVVGGTSCTTPLWAALIALINEMNGRPVGFINRLLYRNAFAFTDVVCGNNGYNCDPGWDPVTGLGSPTRQLVDRILADMAAGV